MIFDFQTEPLAPFATFEEATRYLERMCAVFAVRHLSYWNVTLEEGYADQVT